MRNPNQVIPRDRLMDHVWDFAFSSFSNIVDVHINGVRKKLRLSRHGVLETVRGVGYRIKTTFSKVSKRVLRRRHSRKSAIPNK
jgi:DNA-binding response OmpR family regulator